MSFPGDLMSEPCTIVTRVPTGGHDAGGNPTYTETTVDTVCYREQLRLVDEFVNAEDIVSDRWRVYLPPAAVVTAASSIRVGGDTLRVHATPYRGYNPISRSVDYIECVCLNTKVVA